MDSNIICFANRRPTANRRDVTLFIDLDDTLVDTYGLIIEPLERCAAEAISEIEGCGRKPSEIAAALLIARKRQPDRIHDVLVGMLHANACAAARARGTIFADFPLDSLYLEASTEEALTELTNEFRLILLTEGAVPLQGKKIVHLQLCNYFDSAIIVDCAYLRSKKHAIARYVNLNKIDIGSVIVIGNRLDNEILVGNELGVPTIWIRHGEGSEMDPNLVGAHPDYIVKQFGEVPLAIRNILGLPRADSS